MSVRKCKGKGSWTRSFNAAAADRDEQDLFADLATVLSNEDANKATALIFNAKNADVDILSTHDLIEGVRKSLANGLKVEAPVILDSLVRQRVLGGKVHGATPELESAADRLFMLMRENAHGQSQAYGVESAQILYGVFAGN